MSQQENQYIYVIYAYTDQKQEINSHLVEESEKIQNIMDTSNSKFIVVPNHVKTVQAVSDAINSKNIRPQIIHFSGEGTEKGGKLIISGEEQAVDALKPEDLAGFLNNTGVKCVILNFCYSCDAAEAIAKTGEVEYVIGIHGLIEVNAAINFSESFYKELQGNLLNPVVVEAAFDKGQAAAFPITEDKKYEIFYQGKNGNLVDPKYASLKELLKARKWQEADNETFRIISEILKIRKDDVSCIEALKTFPCPDLGTIEQLWLTYSKKRFGFNEQMRIHGTMMNTMTPAQRENDAPWNEFLNHVGWNEMAISAQTEQNAPDGHFPATGIWWQNCESGWLEALFSRLKECGADLDADL